MLLKICSSQPSQDIHHTLQLTRYNSQLTSYLNTLTHMTHITTHNSLLTSVLTHMTHNSPTDEDRSVSPELRLMLYKCPKVCFCLHEENLKVINIPLMK